MERYAHLKKILYEDSKKDKIKFLRNLLEILFEPVEIPEEQEQVYAKGILYICCWVLMPKSSIKVLPAEFQQINSLLDTDTSDLLNDFFGLFSKNYKNLSLIIRNDTLLSLALTISPQNKDFLSILQAKDCIPPLLWLLTYSPDHLKLASSFLPLAISKPNGVNELIQAFARGDNSFKLKNLATKVLKSLPSNNKTYYLENVIPQMIEIITEFECDLYVENILEQVLNSFLQSYSQIFLNVLENVEKKLDVDQIVKLYRVLIQTTPSHKVVLYRVSKKFVFFMNLFEFVCFLPLQIKKDIFVIFVQFFCYWEESVVSFIDYADNPLFLYRFCLSDQGKLVFDEITERKYSENFEKIQGMYEKNITKTQKIKEKIVKNNENNEKKAEEPDLIKTYDSLAQLIQMLSDNHGGSTTISSIFVGLLKKHEESPSFSIIYLINFMLLSLDPIFLINLPAQIQDFLVKTLNSQDEKLILISLQILLHSIPGNYDKTFYLLISPQIIEFSHSKTPEISEISTKVNNLISFHLQTPFSPSVHKKTSYSQILSDIDSSESYVSAIALHKLSLVLRNFSVIPWDSLSKQLTKDVFVFGELLKCYLIGLHQATVEGLEDLFINFEVSESFEVKSRILEILFFWVKKGVLKFLDKVLNFLDFVFLHETDENLKNGALMIAAEGIKKLKTGNFRILPRLIYNVLGIIRLGTSRLASNAEILQTTGAALVVINKIVKYSDFSHLEEYWKEIVAVVDVFDGYYKKTDNVRILLNNLQRNINVKKSVIEELL